MIHVGVVGCGSIGKVHAEILKGTQEVRLEAFADIKKERAEAYSKQFSSGKARSYASITEMLQEEQLDAVHICTPHFCHVPQAMKVLRKGISVFMEKPPAISKEQFEQLKKEEEKSKGTLGICFQNRYNETTKKVSEILEKGILGDIKGARAFVTWHRDAAYYTESGWRGKLESEGGGALINQSIHTLDLLLLWLGKPLWLEASMKNHHLRGIIEVEDTIEAYLVFSKGSNPITANFYAATSYCEDLPVLLDISCERGFIRLEGDQVWYQEKGKEPVFFKVLEKSVLGKSYWGSGHEACIKDFYESLKAGDVYQNNLESCSLTFQTMMEIYQSAREEEK